MRTKRSKQNNNSGSYGFTFGSHGFHFGSYGFHFSSYGFLGFWVGSYGFPEANFTLGVALAWLVL